MFFLHYTTAVVSKKGAIGLGGPKEQRPGVPLTASQRHFFAQDFPFWRSRRGSRKARRFTVSAASRPAKLALDCHPAWRRGAVGINRSTGGLYGSEPFHRSRHRRAHQSFYF